jgi:hypothetical protein
MSYPDIENAITSGLLTETHYTEVKAELGPSSDGVNTELARDAASFSIDGGTLIYEVAEEDGRLRIAPVELKGLGERIEQICRSRIDPPLHVRCRELYDSDSSTGCLVVDIPVSPDAPHQVKGKYWGRNDKTKYTLRAHAKLDRAVFESLDRVVPLAVEGV